MFYLFTKVAQIFGYFIPRLKFCNSFDKKWVGLHFGRFFPNSSGHPAANVSVY
jgi:hypothetical protein